MKGDIHNNLASTSRHETNSNHIDSTLILSLELLFFSVIWYLKLQVYTNLLLMSTAFSTLLYSIISLTTVNERIHKEHYKCSLTYLSWTRFEHLLLKSSLDLLLTHITLVSFIFPVNYISNKNSVIFSR